MNAHTPGPWLTSGTAGHETHGQWSVYADNGKTVAIVYDGPRDARLIAAAPVMYEVLQSILEWTEARNGTPEGDELALDAISEQAQAAILKATGRTA